LAGSRVLPGGTTAAPQDRAPARPLVLAAEYDGIIHPIAVEYLTGVIHQADTSGAALVVIVLRTSGGLLDSAQAIVSRLIQSHAPVVVFVEPAGARVPSAGFILTMAADVAVIALGTHIGAAHPVSGSSFTLSAQQIPGTNAGRARVKSMETRWQEIST
jgi:membrane-bound serine protease (ClpP class)